jgi:HlyD family secretion protein
MKLLGSKPGDFGWKPVAATGYAVIILTFGFLGGWAAVAEIDKAVIANGYVSIETNSKTVQHFEGGIVKEILVKEGARVKEGDVLFRLQPIQAQANTDLLVQQLETSLALEARLVAERDSSKEIVWPAELESQMQEPYLKRALTDQSHEFEQRRVSLEGQVSVLRSRIEQLQKEIEGIGMEKDSAEKQETYINAELVNLREAAAKQLVPMARVYAQERERTRLEGIIGRAIADTAKANGSVSEVNIQIQQLRQKFQEEVSASLIDVRQKIADARERIRVARDVLKRITIEAPRTGTVQNLKVFTVGQVIRPAEALLEVVPDDEPFVVNAQFSPSDIDSIHAGMNAEIRFPAFHSRTVPVMTGLLETISHDRLLDDQTRQYYFLAVISLKRADIPEEYRSRLRSGMPAEVIIASGQRTVLSYIVSPLSSAMHKAFLE